MAYSDLDVDIVYEGDGVTKIFPINFAFTDEDYVKVELWDVTDPDNPISEGISFPSEWSIVGTDVVLTDALPASKKLLIYRDSTPVHDTNYSEYEFPFATMNTDLDKVYQLAQENRRTLDRALLNPRFNFVSGDGSQVDLDTVATNQENIATNAADIATNVSDIATNAANIATNAGDIVTNANDIATNAAGIAQNVLDIASNSSDISTLQGQIGLITTPTIYSIIAAETYNAVNANIVIIDTNDAVQVNLPAEAAGISVTVKVSEKVGSKTVVAATSIDGFGTTYTLSSEYEAVKFVCDGTKWYII